jgi:hypothetical protein
MVMRAFMARCHQTNGGFEEAYSDVCQLVPVEDTYTRLYGSYMQRVLAMVSKHSKPKLL